MYQNSSLMIKEDVRYLNIRMRNMSWNGLLEWLVRWLLLTVYSQGFSLAIQVFFVFIVVFGTWNQFSFSIFAGLGYLAILVLNALSRRTIHRIYLKKDLETVDVEFFNAFWVFSLLILETSNYKLPYFWIPVAIWLIFWIHQSRTDINR